MVADCTVPNNPILIGDIMVSSLIHLECVIQQHAPAPNTCSLEGVHSVILRHLPTSFYGTCRRPCEGACLLLLCWTTCRHMVCDTTKNHCVPPKRRKPTFIETKFDQPFISNKLRIPQEMLTEPTKRAYAKHGWCRRHYTSHAAMRHKQRRLLYENSID